MVNEDPWRSSGAWLRCALHSHTTRSDGDLPPDAVAAHYARAGYDVLAITDHWKVTDAQSVDGLLVIPSTELNCVLPGARDGHVLAFGVQADDGDLEELAEDFRDLAEMGAWITGRSGVAFLAHPYWTGVTPGTLELPETVTGIEVYNAGCELEVGRGLSAVHWDELLGAGRLCPAIATDDSHHHGFDSDHAWTWVKAAEPSREAVLGALASGRFYASAGPSLRDVTVDGALVEVSCSPCRSVTLVSGKSTGSAVNAGRLGYTHRGRILERNDAGLITRAMLQAPVAARHVRVEATDTAGHKAWAPPIAV